VIATSRRSGLRGSVYVRMPFTNGAKDRKHVPRSF
jgi:hypothetical protein